MEAVVASVLSWYAGAARDLPWRHPDTTPYGVLVSEVMLQQTPVSRVLVPYREWLARWPDIRSLAAAPSGEAVRQWGRLGYPRRALRLHAAAVACVERHEGQVPDEYGALRALPGVGDYTAAAVASFAYGQRHVVLDTNVRRVLARALRGEATPAAHLTVTERTLAERLLPEDHRAPTWSVAVMELGALICTARAPQCSRCPLLARCAWVGQGCPEAVSPRRSQGYAGTDRQVRGRLLALVRDSPQALPRSVLDTAWPDPVQRERALSGLLADGLLVEHARGRLGLPG